MTPATVRSEGTDDELGGVIVVARSGPGATTVFAVATFVVVSPLLVTVVDFCGVTVGLLETGVVFCATTGAVF